MSQEAVSAPIVLGLLIAGFAAFSFQAAVRGRYIAKWLIWTVVCELFMLAMMVRFVRGPFDVGGVIATLIFSTSAGAWMAIGGCRGILAMIAKDRSGPE